MHSPDANGRPQERRIGSILLSMNATTEEQLEEALEVQKTDKRSIGKILVSLGYLSHDDLAHALSIRLNVKYAALSVQVDQDVLGIIGEDVLLQHKAIPLRVENGRLVVAMSDPNDVYARSELTVSAGYPVTPVVAAEDAVRRLQDRLFGGEGSAQSAVAELDAVEVVRAAEAAALQSDQQTGGAVDVTVTRKAERAEPGAQPEGDPGEPVVQPAVASGAKVGHGSQVRPARGRGRKGGGRIGDILISMGKITEEQLEQALSMQRNDPRDLGRILLSLGYVVPADIARALAKRLKLDYVVVSELSEDEIDPEALNFIGEATLRKYLALPLRFEDGDLVVAMADPNDIYALEDLKIIAKRPIKPAVATEEDLRGAFAHLFGSEEDLYTGMDGEESAGPDLAEPEAAPLPEPLPEEEPEEYGATEKVQPGSEGASLGYLGDDGGGSGSLARVEGARGKKVAIGGGRIGDILISQGKITEKQLEQALMLQKENPREVGQVLLSLGYVSKADLARALARRLRLEYIELTERDVDKGAAALVDQKVLRKHGAVPLRLENNRLVVAMSDPTNIYALEDLMMISGYPVTPVVALEEEIRRIYVKVFAVSEEVSEFLQEAGKQSVQEDHGVLDLGVDAGPEEAPIIKLVSSILQQAVGDGASDIHIEPQARELAVRMRVDGVLRETMSIPPKLQNGVVARLKIVSNLDIAERRVPQDGRFSLKLGGQKIDLRVASLPTVYGEKVVLRLLDTSNAQVELTQLGFPKGAYEKYEEIFRRPYGTILVTGPTGSGKSTTLYATLGELNTPEKNIITVEDPVEYRIHGINQIQTNPKAGLTFASALRSILRADPDIVMIGEIRDFETAQIAVEAALTGHLVLSTLHTNDAPGALSRLTDMGVEPFLTSSAVDCVIAQRLARRLCERCKEPVEIEEEILAGMRFPFESAPSRPNFHKTAGCNFCSGTGYRGRIGIYELMVVTEKIKDMILRRASTGEISRIAEEEGMIRLRKDGLLKAAAGTTTIEEVLRTVI